MAKLNQLKTEAEPLLEQKAKIDNHAHRYKDCTFCMTSLGIHLWEDASSSKASICPVSQLCILPLVLTGSLQLRPNKSFREKVLPDFFFGIGIPVKSITWAKQAFYKPTLSACRVSKAVLWTGLAVFTAQVVLYARLTFWELSWWAPFVGAFLLQCIRKV